MSHSKVLALALCACAAGLILAIPAWAQDAPPPTTDERVTALEGKVGEAANVGHNAWMLTSCALVLFMTAPGLAMFYGGLVRKKNVLGVMMQCITLMGLNTVLWALVGYSLAFGGGLTADNKPDEAAGGYNQWIGNTQYVFMKNVAHEWEVPEGETDDTKGKRKVAIEGAIPKLTHMLFQGMFFIITPALICGAYAERMKFSTMVVFSTLWGLLI
jgi:Amt family ammonium transporter